MQRDGSIENNVGISLARCDSTNEDHIFLESNSSAAWNKEKVVKKKNIGLC